MKLDKILKQLDPETIKEMDALSEADVKSAIAESEQAIATATKERDANPGYQEAKENVKALSEGLRDVKKRQNAKIAYGLRCLSRLAGNDLGDEE